MKEAAYRCFNWNTPGNAYAMVCVQGPGLASVTTARVVARSGVVNGSCGQLYVALSVLV